MHDFLATRAAEYHLSLLGGSQSWLIPFQFVTVVRFVLSRLTGGAVPLFAPSGGVDTRDAKTLARRLKTALWNDGFVIHIVIIASIVAGLAGLVKAASHDDDSFWRGLFVRAA